MCIFFRKKYLFSIIALSVVFANPPFDLDGDGLFDGAGAFDFDAQVTAVVENGSIGVAGQE